MPQLQKNQLHADPARGVFYPLALGLQLLLVGDMADIASAAAYLCSHQL